MTSRLGPTTALESYAGNPAGQFALSLTFDRIPSLSVVPNTFSFCSPSVSLRTLFQIFWPPAVTTPHITIDAWSSCPYLLQPVHLQPKCRPRSYFHKGQEGYWHIIVRRSWGPSSSLGVAISAGDLLADLVERRCFAFDRFEWLSINPACLHGRKCSGR